MNEKNTQVKITMPLIDDIELQNIDTFYNNIVSEYTKAFVKEKEQVIAQRLMMNLQKENTELKEKVKNMENLQKRIDKALDFIDCHFKEMVADEEAQELKSILSEIKIDRPVFLECVINTDYDVYPIVPPNETLLNLICN